MSQHFFHLKLIALNELHTFYHVGLFNGVYSIFFWLSHDVSHIIQVNTLKEGDNKTGGHFVKEHIVENVMLSLRRNSGHFVENHYVEKQKISG